MKIITTNAASKARDKLNGSAMVGPASVELLTSQVYSFLQINTETRPHQY